MVFKKYKLKDLGEIVTGKTPKKSNKEYYNSNDIMFIKPDDLFQDNILLLDKSKEYISKKGAETVRVLPKNSVLVTCIGTIGKVAILYSDKAAFNQQINAIIPNEKIIISKFLAYSIWFNRLKLQAIANAPIVPIINKTQFSEFEIQVPNIDYQKKVVNILDKASDLINKRKSQIEALDQLTQSVFLEMFGDPSTNPKRWKIVNLEEIAIKEKGAIKSGPFGSQLLISEYVKNGIPVLGIDNVKKNKFVWAKPKAISEQKYKELKAFRVYSGDVLISRTGTVGRTCVVPDDFKEGIIGPNLLKVTLDKNLMLPEVLSIMFNYLPHVINQIKWMSPGATVPVFNTKNLKKVKVLVPDIKVQVEFVKKIKEVEELKSKFILGLNDLEKNYNSLMQRAFKDELFIEEKVSNL